MTLLQTLNKHDLSEPVELGEVRLAPTVELAGLAELSALQDHGAQVEALLRIAASLREEDEERERVAALRDEALVGERRDDVLPKRR